MTSSVVFRSESTPTPGPVGHKGPRGEILMLLKRRIGATAQELAEELGCSLNAVRHHLKELEAEAVIGYDRTPKGVGAPAHTWRLTPAGHALFPDRYDRTVLDLLDHIVASEGRGAAVAVLEKQYVGLADRLRAAAGGLSGAARGEAVAAALSAEGYIATWEAHPDGRGELVERHCPHRLLAERFPEICAAERRVLEEVLEMNVQRRCRIAGGCGTCSYEVGAETR
ncbi:MAG TPA: helix-turn-helix domain-containing protein [Gemmatimonadales bacterium]|nr:helix-turn-helix domain-containing protein [Gemmatimonadales bacterium]